MISLKLTLSSKKIWQLSLSAQGEYEITVFMSDKFQVYEIHAYNPISNRVCKCYHNGSEISYM